MPVLRVQPPIWLPPTVSLICSLPFVPRARTTIVLLPLPLLEELLLLLLEELEDELLEEELEDELPLPRLMVKLPLAPFQASPTIMQ